MPFIKLGELIEISGVENAESCIPQVSAEVLENFRKYAANLKRVAPRAEDFLYFSAIMMHAAEAAALHDDGTKKITASGSPVEVGWDKTNGTWRWVSNDPSIKPYKNSNGDIFPEEELVKAYKKWKDKPLCIDHKSSSVDHVRGFIVDTYYDRNLKRVVALCALDKAGFPQLARQISTGMSNCVSMGTAVGKAICTEAGCHRVARTESDFCTHMKTKSGYGEINVDLNPMELSIVVNGADPKANIKHIIASANTMNEYLDNRSKELAKLAHMYSATLSRSSNTTEAEGSDSNTITINNNDIELFKQDVDRGLQQLASINSKISEKDTNDLAFTQSSGTVAMDETVSPNTDSGLAPPHARFAETGADSISDLRKAATAIEEKLGLMKQSLEKLAKTSNTPKQEETMSGSKEMNKKGYYLGTEEPTPGQAKYPKDPLNEKLRTDGDKHMEGESPFPETGPVDGMYPGDLDRKKMLARAEAEERALKRQAIVNLAKQALEDKKGYFNNGQAPNNPNTPTPGKVKYPIDKGHMAFEDDKHMSGQKPFPGVGAVDGMHPSPASADVSDEKKRKEMLARASLRARFVKAANADGSLNQAKSTWEVYLGEKLLLTASVNELSGGQTEKYGSIATREFGTQLIENVKFFGADKVRSLVKSAQPAPVEAPPAEAAPPADAGAPPADMPPAEDTGASGDPKESALELAEKARDVNSDLVEAVKALTGEKDEMGEGGPSTEMGATASRDLFSVANLSDVRRELNGELIQSMKEAIANLNDHQQELEMISSMYDRGAVSDANSEFVGSIVEDALSEAKTAIAEGFRLMTAFVKYARGTKAIVKRAEIEAELEALAEGETMSTENDSHSDSDLMSLINETNADLDDVNDMMSDDNALGLGDESLESLENIEDLDGLGLADDNDAGPVVEVKPGQQLPQGLEDDAVVKVTASFDSKAGRAALRAKLAADALGKEDDGQVQDMSKQKFSDMLDQADSLADGNIKLETKPSDNLGRVETLPEINKEMLELAKAPPNVRKEAEAIYKLVSSGALDPADLDALVAEGLDKDAVAYYKKYFGEVDGGSEFAGELVKEHVKAQLENEINQYKVKMARAYELAHDMVDRGLCHNDRSAISSQVDEIMNFGDEQFNTLKRVVAKHAPLMRKEAGRMPQVGMIGSGDVNTSTPTDSDDWSQLSAAFSKTSKRMF
jgi:hypothetical protein